jgi:alkylation response protein AidB-like acyl-CoA dehydrogenase
MILSEKHQMMQKLFRSFAKTEFTPELLDRLEETGEFDWDIHYKMAKAGLLGAKIPVQYGGQEETT